MANPVVDGGGPIFMQATDPGAVGPGRLWLNTTTGLLQTRNLANTAWTTATGAGTSGESLATTKVTNAQILALHATPISIIPAPAALHVVIPTKIYCVADCAAGAYTLNGGTLGVHYHGDPGGWSNLCVLPVALLNAAALSPFTENTVTMPSGQTLALPAATGVDIANDGAAEFTVGNAANSLSVYIWYVTLPVAALP